MRIDSQTLTISLTPKLRPSVVSWKSGTEWFLDLIQSCVLRTVNGLNCVMLGLVPPTCASVFFAWRGNPVNKVGGFPAAYRIMGMVLPTHLFARVTEAGFQLAARQKLKQSELPRLPTLETFVRGV